MRVSLARDRTRACEGTSPFASSRASGFREHTTVARFRQRHQDALAEVFGEALSPEAPSRLCATATMESKRGGIAVIREIRITVSTARVRLLILRFGSMGCSVLRGAALRSSWWRRTDSEDDDRLPAHQAMRR